MSTSSSTTAVSTRYSSTSVTETLMTSTGINIGGRGSKSKYNAVLASYDSVGMYVIYITISVMLLLVGMSYMYHEYVLKCMDNGYKGTDPVQYIAILKFFQNTVDFWTDLFFAFVLYLQGLWPLWGYAAIFIFVPYIVSCITAVICTVRWRHWNMDHPTRLHQYLSRYEFFVYFLTIVAGFYSALDLTRSKLLYKKCYYFPLKREEFSNLKHWRFVNIVVLEVSLLDQYVLYLLTDD